VPVGDRTGRVVGWLIVLLIVINLVAITLQTMPEFETWYAAWFLGIELVSLVVFTRIAGAFSPFGGEDAADLGRMCVKADRQPDIYLERHARDVGAEPAANVAARSMLFTAVATG
jgi:hypothetical protein